MNSPAGPHFAFMDFNMGRRPKLPPHLDTELADLPPDLRWREWMGRVEAVIFASSAPVLRDALARVVGKDCNLNLIIEDIRAELRNRPYELVKVAGGWQHRTRRVFADAIRSAANVGTQTNELSKSHSLVLTAIAYLQPITRTELSQILGRDVSRDTIAFLRAAGLISSGPRSPQAGAPFTYVTTAEFLSRFNLSSLRDLPDIDHLVEAGLLSKENLITETFLQIPAVAHLSAAEDDGY